jgi:hypothetical protein
MVITKLIGGLGNQMFQYAAGRALAKKLNTQLKLDTSWFKKISSGITQRDYELDCFKIQSTFAKQSDLLYFHLFKKLPFVAPNYFKEKSVNYDDRIRSIRKKSVFLEGYWQSEKYFKDYKKTIRKDFTFICNLNIKGKELLKQIKKSNSVSIHVRRGDYITNKNASKFHGVCDLKYYYESIKVITNKIKNPVFYVFSDDINWCKSNLKITYPSIYVDGNKKDWEDLFLMSNCKHNIVANSSFSWWGGWLNDNSNKVVIAPKRWFVGVETKIEDRFPSDWELL